MNDIAAVRRQRIRKMQQELYKKDPLHWLEHRFGEPRQDFEWSLRPGYDDHEWDGTPDPLAKAWRSIAAHRSTAIESGVGTSKTYSLARIVLWFLDCFEDSLVVTSAPKQDQLRRHLWAEITKVFHKFKKVRPKTEMQVLRLMMEPHDDNEEMDPDEIDLSESWHAIGFVAGVEAGEEATRKAQGFHRKHMLIITEETPGIPGQVMTAFKNTITGEHNMILAVGNPDHQMDTLHTFAKLPWVDHVRISALDHPNIVQQEELIPGAVTQGSIDAKEQEYGKESKFYQTRVRGISPAQSEDSLIRLDWIQQCYDIDPEDVEDRTFVLNSYGVDAAQSAEGDKAAVACFQGVVLGYVKEFQCSNATDLAYNIMKNDVELEMDGVGNVYGIPSANSVEVSPDCIGVDAVGIGVATVNAFRENGWPVEPLQGGQWEEAIPEDEEGKPLYNFVSLRAQMWWELREDLRKKRIAVRLPDKEVRRKLAEELATPKFDSRASTIAVEKKEKVKERLGRSPNLADATAYANWMRKGYRQAHGGLPIVGG